MTTLKPNNYPDYTAILPRGGTVDQVLQKTSSTGNFVSDWATLAAIALSGSASDLVMGTVPTAALPAVNTDIGMYGDSSHVAQVTLDAQGRVTAATAVGITPAAIGAPSGSGTATGTNTGDQTLAGLGGLAKTSNLSDVASVAAARVNLNIDSRTTHGDSDYSISSTDRHVELSSDLTATRTWTLPAASSVNAGQTIVISDRPGHIVPPYTIVIARSGSDTIDTNPSVIISTPKAVLVFYSNGINGWAVDARLARSVGENGSFTDSNQAAVGVLGGPRIIEGTSLTANRNATFTANSAGPGDVIEYRRIASDTFSRVFKNVAGTTLVSAASGRTYRFAFHGTDWIYWGSSAD